MSTQAARPGRPPVAEDPSGFVRSYGYMRLAIGVAALALPVLLILVDWWFTTDDRFLTDENDVRDSMSAYYHTAARDVFVGGLVVVGVLLLTYRLGQLVPPRHWSQARTVNGWALSAVSLLAGALVIVVALVPTARDTSGDPRWVECVYANGCTALQQELGEADAARLHTWAAILFTVCLFALCLLFMWEERIDDGSWVNPRNTVHAVAALLILLAGLTLFFGWTVPAGFWGFSLAPVYLAELLAFGGFSVSWLAVAREIVRTRRAAHLHV